VLLTGVEPVPHVIHLMINLVREARLIVQHVDWGNISVFPVFIVSDHVENCDLFVATYPSVPIVSELTIADII
jgi:hypothetical protein